MEFILIYRELIVHFLVGKTSVQRRIPGNLVFQLEEMKRSRVERLVTFNLQTETIPTRGASLTSNRDLESCLCPV